MTASYCSQPAGPRRLAGVCCLAFLIIWGFLIGYSPTAGAQGLDTSGTYDGPPKCSATFHLIAVSVSQVTIYSTTYNAVGNLTYQRFGNITCPTGNALGTVRAVWNYDNKVFAEQGGVTEGGEFKAQVSSLSKCDSDPMLNKNAQCERIDSMAHDWHWPEKRPFTPPLVPQDRRKGLLSRVESLIVPQIKVPTPNQNIKGINVLFQAKVYIPQLSAYKSNGEVEVKVTQTVWPSPGAPTPMNKTVKVPVHGNYALVTIPLKHGSFHIDARFTKPPSQKWAKGVNFMLVP
jgi:hypothetical protein